MYVQSMYNVTRLSQDLLEFRISLRLAKLLFHFISFCLFCSILILTFLADKVTDKETRSFAFPSLITKLSNAK